MYLVQGDRVHVCKYVCGYECAYNDGNIEKKIKQIITFKHLQLISSHIIIYKFTCVCVCVLECK